MVYNNVPWKRNINKIPSSIFKKLKTINTDLIVAAATKLVRHSEISELYTHISFPKDAQTQTSILPIPNMGKFSYRNANGWDIVRHDLPMIKKTYYWETPNFGDASTYGTHTHYQDRDVYQREFFEPRFYKINIEKISNTSPKNGPSIPYKFSLDHLLDLANPNFERELFFMLNILQENIGACDIFSSKAKREEYLGTLHLEWEIFPTGKNSDIASYLIRGKNFSKINEDKIKSRIALFSSLKPRAFLKGSGGMSSYIGAQYADDLVVFENIQYGNALYILYDNWEEVSSRPRTEILRGTNANYDRIVHNEGWEEIFHMILKKEKWKRGLR